MPTVVTESADTGLLCFADEYQVETWRDGTLATFIVGTEAIHSLFVLRSEILSKRDGSGTRLLVDVARKLPDPDEKPEWELRYVRNQSGFSLRY